MIHGYVAKIHDDPADEEFELYGGTIDVGEFPDETASREPMMYKEVLLARLKDNLGDFMIVPTLFSDVTIVSDAGTKYIYVLNYSHADILQLQAHTESRIGVTETETLGWIWKIMSLRITMSWSRPGIKPQRCIRLPVFILLPEISRGIFQRWR